MKVWKLIKEDRSPTDRVLAERSLNYAAMSVWNAKCIIRRWIWEHILSLHIYL